MRKYDYQFLKAMTVPTSFLSVTNGIYALRSEEEKKKTDFPAIFTRLQELAIVQSVKGSNAIEGIITTDQRIEEIVKNSSAPLNHNEQEIAGYRDALRLIHENYESIPLNERTVLHLHEVLLSHTDMRGGVYKREDNIIRESYSDGTSRVRWVPVSAKETPSAMEQLLLAYTEARDDSGINQLLLIPCFVLDFLCVHPFRDGNGRMSRLLSLLLLYKSGFDISQYISFEEQINRTKGNYYEALKQSSVGWHENRNNDLPFMENFVFTLYCCYKELDKRFLTLNSGKISKTKRIEETVLNAFLPISKKEICNLLVDVSPTTVEAVLGMMLKEGKIVKIGSARNTKYYKKQ